MNDIKQKYPMVDLVVYIIGLFDPYSEDHSENVAKLSVKIGAKYGITEPELEELELAALLHDIGKMGMPESIRAKPGRLTEAEYFLIQQHAVIGFNIVNRMNGKISPMIKKAIYHHHENYGGNGYPLGLRGTEIPLMARIIRIADSYDALTNSRGFRLPLQGGSAIELMVKDQEKCNLYDPELFKCFLQVMMDK